MAAIPQSRGVAVEKGAGLVFLLKHGLGSVSQFKQIDKSQLKAHVSYASNCSALRYGGVA